VKHHEIGHAQCQVSVVARRLYTARKKSWGSAVSLDEAARNPDTGMASWAYQMTPHDASDYDGVNESVLTDANVDGQTVPTLTHFDRNGFAYVIDRRNGKLL
jgi:glucose dehydrogenase